MQLCTKLAMSTYTINFYQNLTFKMQKKCFIICGSSLDPYWSSVRWPRWFNRAKACRRLFSTMPRLWLFVSGGLAVSGSLSGGLLSWIHFLEIPKFPYNTVRDKPNVTSVPKTSSLRSFIGFDRIEHCNLIVTAKHWAVAYTALCIGGVRMLCVAR